MVILLHAKMQDRAGLGLEFLAKCIITDTRFSKVVKINGAVSQAVMRSSLKQDVRGSNLGPVNLESVLLTACRCCEISLKVAVWSGRNDAEMGPHARYMVRRNTSEYNEKFDFEINLCH